MNGPAIRPCAAADYPGVVAVINRASPEYAFTEDAYRARDGRRDPKCVHARWVAEDDAGRVVGMGQYDQRVEMYHPRRFLLSLYVDPDHQRRGIGRRLYDTVMAALGRFDPLSVRAFAVESRPPDVAFWQNRGFREDMRDGGARLNLAAFDPAVFAGAADRATEVGIAIRTLTELASDPDRDRKVWELDAAIAPDIPPRGERTPMDFDTYRRTRLDRPDLLPDAYFLAVAPDGSYIGVSALRVPPDGSQEYLATGLTGVRAEWRRYGIALALKVAAARWAKEQGYTYLRTWNASDNEPVLALNRRLGFVREPWRVHLVKTIGTEDTAA
jgi:GNAT superfamily N-acetyltransferase